MGKTRSDKISRPSILRLCKIYSLLDELEETGDKTISSQYIGKRLGVASHNIRKDLSFLADPGIVGAGYEIIPLKSKIETALGLKHERNACVIGFNELGIALLKSKKMYGPQLNIIAGFDSNINRLETIKTDIPVFPTYEITDITARYNIEIAVIADYDKNIHKINERLIDGGIKGIVNLSPVILSSHTDDVYILNVDLIGEFRFLSALIKLEKTQG